MDKLKTQQINILKALANQIDDFYLVGGTALSLFYFDHRESEDLDFFTQKFSPERVRQVVDLIKKQLPVQIKPEADNLSETGKSKIMTYNARMEGRVIKIDFVEDAWPLIEPVQRKDGINILSVKDIYLKKVYAVSGHVTGLDEVGREKTVGGRQKGKDLFDLYYLSREVLSLSEFVNQYCDQAQKAGVIRWFRTFDRTQIKLDLAEVKTKNKLEFSDIDRHLGEEIRKILVGEIS